MKQIKFKDAFLKRWNFVKRITYLKTKTKELVKFQGKIVSFSLIVTVLCLSQKKSSYKYFKLKITYNQVSLTSTICPFSEAVRNYNPKSMG